MRSGGLYPRVSIVPDLSVLVALWAAGLSIPEGIPVICPSLRGSTTIIGSQLFPDVSALHHDHTGLLPHCATQRWFALTTVYHSFHRVSHSGLHHLLLLLFLSIDDNPADEVAVWRAGHHLRLEPSFTSGTKRGGRRKGAAGSGRRFLVSAVLQQRCAATISIGGSIGVASTIATSLRCGASRRATSRALARFDEADRQHPAADPAQRRGGPQIYRKASERISSGVLPSLQHITPSCASSADELRQHRCQTGQRTIPTPGAGADEQSLADEGGDEHQSGAVPVGLRFLSRCCSTCLAPSSAYHLDRQDR